MSRGQIVAGIAIVLVLGAMVERRTATPHPRTDLRVYLRAAWAVRQHEPSQLYRITDDHGWHYLYPPLLAILAAPLADPPPAALGLPVRTAASTQPIYLRSDDPEYATGRYWAGVPPTLRFAWAVGVWYLISVACLIAGIELLARRIELAPGRSVVSPAILRWVPLAAAAPPLANGLVRGQVEPILMLFFGATLWLAARRRQTWSGFWLSMAICIKVIPAFLLLWPLWRRDARALGGAALGLLLGLVVIPVAVFGVSRTASLYSDYARSVLMPGLGHSTGDRSRADELLDQNATDNQSLLSVMSNTAVVLSGRMSQAIHQFATGTAGPPAAGMRRASYAIGLLMVLAVLWVTPFGASRPAKAEGTIEVLFFGLLIVPMILLSPVCHSHYFLLLIPLMMGLIAAAADKPAIRRRVLMALILNGVAGVCLSLPGINRVERNLGIVTYPALLLWGMGLLELRRMLRSSVRLMETERCGPAAAPQVGS